MSGSHNPCRVPHTRVYKRSEANDEIEDVSHLLCLTSPNTAGRAICGAEPHWDDMMWLGTGTQTEMDQVKVLPLCSDCRDAVKS